jgi:formyl-CoA transferase
LVRDPQDVIKDPQLLANNSVVPLEGAGDSLKLTVSSPIQVHGVAKIPAKRAPELGEHNGEVLKELGFAANEIEQLGASGVFGKPTSPTSKPTAKAA